MAKPQKQELDFRLAVQRAVEIVGGVRLLWKAMGKKVSYTTLYNYMRKTVRPPSPDDAIAIEAAVKGRVDRLEFYPMMLHGPLGRRIGLSLRRHRDDAKIAALLKELAARGLRF